DRGLGIYLGVAEQYTFFGTTKIDGHEVTNVADQYERSAITQLVAGYNVTDRFGVQVNIPLIYRDYKRPAGFVNERGTESGFGDVSLLFNYVAFRKEAGFHPGATNDSSDSKDGKESAAPPASALFATGRGGAPDFSLSCNLLAGVKFPTGDESRVK
ncbi:MAG: hypothetical protein JO117_04410, partial [Verrucomicrobia bacterium]|nr:hypothetical protein [Verrucomicrobiota bacterium]